MKKVLIVLAVLMLGGISFGQVAGRFDAPAQTVVNFAGRTFLAPSAGASVTICAYPATGGLPCTNKASVCPDSTAVGCTTGAPNNPIVADTEGNFGFWALAGTYSYSVCPVSGVCDGPYIATIAADINGLVAHATLADTATLALNSNKVLFGNRGFLNAVDDCFFPSDKVSDSCTAMAACVATHPGWTIGLPLLVDPGSGMAAATPQSYFSSCKWIPHGNSTKIVGLAGNVRWLGGVKVKFATGVGGIQMATPTSNDCASCEVRDLFLEGSDAAVVGDSATYEDFSSSSTLIGDGADCLQFNSGSQTVSGVRCSSFKRHGFVVLGSSTGEPDLWSIRDSWADTNRGCGYFIDGADSNVGNAGGVNSSTSNLLCGYRGGSFFGTKWDSTHSSHNGLTSLVAGANKTIAAANGIVVASNVATITTTTAHGWTVGKWVTTTASTDPTFNGTCKLLTVPLTTTATCNFTHADGNTANGTAATASGTEIKAYYTAHSVKMGSYISIANDLFNMPYSEIAVDGTPDFGSAALCIQGAQFAVTDQTCNWITALSGNIIQVRTKFLKFVPKDSSGIFAVMDPTASTNEFTVDPAGVVTTIGNRVNLGTSPSANNNAINMSNTWGIYAKTTAAANSRGVYFHSDDTWYLGDSTRLLHLQATTTDASGAFTVTGLTTASGGLKTTLYQSSTNCSSTGGTCAAAPAGSVGIAAAATTVTVATTAVTANSQIFIQEDSTLGTKLTATCNTTTGRTYTVTTRTAGTSFVITASAAPVTNPACLSYFIVN